MHSESQPSIQPEQLGRLNMMLLVSMGFGMVSFVFTVLAFRANLSFDTSSQAGAFPISSLNEAQRNEGMAMIITPFVVMLCMIKYGCFKKDASAHSMYEQVGDVRVQSLSFIIGSLCSFLFSLLATHDSYNSINSAEQYNQADHANFDLSLLYQQYAFNSVASMCLGAGIFLSLGNCYATRQLQKQVESGALLNRR